MTNTEAIKILDDLRSYDYDKIHELYQDKPMTLTDALDMAIKALEQEPKYCDRNICLKNEYNGIGCNECEVTKSQEPKWIPVSERLPEEQGIYLAYIINEYDNRFQYPMTACFSPNKVGCLPQWFPDDETASNNVVAWMPLPKRYEPQERSDKECTKKI